jgi:PAS domain S-box-containing protein
MTAILNALQDICPEPSRTAIGTIRAVCQAVSPSESCGSFIPIQERNNSCELCVRSEKSRDIAAFSVYTGARVNSMAEPEKPIFLTTQDPSTETINLSSLVKRQETGTGSYSFDQLRPNPIAKLLDALPMPALLVDEKHSVTFANTACRTMGLNFDETGVIEFERLFPDPNNSAQAQSLLQHVILHRRQQTWEATVGMDTRRIWGRMHFRSLRYEDKRLILVLVENLTLEKKQQILNQRHQEELRKAHAELEIHVAERTAELVRMNEELQHEITTRQEVEKSLRSSERRFKAVFETAQDSIFIKDAQRRYTHVNPALMKTLGLPKEEIIGKTDEQIFGGRQTSHLRNVESRVLGGQIIESEYTLTIHNRTVTLNCIRVPMRDGSAKVLGICGIARDMTERKEIQGEWRAEPNEFPSAAIKDTLKQVGLAARTDSIVLLLGESGSGKDYLARLLHDLSNRAGGPFLSINCAALAPELVESELFGHEAGSFTGSTGRKRGLLELAEGGTLVLNEIGELSLPLQAKLLAFLDTHSFIRVGGEKKVVVSARMVAATNRNLEAEVQAGNFREDLYYRLNVLTIRVPPLRDRMDDLPILISTLLKALTERMGLTHIPSIDPDAVEGLSRYHWPGNIRELRNVLERALILCDRRRITGGDLGFSSGSRSEQFPQDELRFSVGISDVVSMDDALREAKRALVQEALQRSGGSIKEAALLLGITRASMNHHMKYLGINR